MAFLRLKTLALAGLSFMALSEALGAKNLWENGKASGFDIAQMENLQLVREGDGSEALRLADNEASHDESVDLLLTGNSPEDFHSAHYLIDHSAVIIDQVLPLYGAGSLRFATPENRLLLTPRPGALLSETSDFGSFTLDFWIYPYSHYDQEEVFTHYGSFYDPQRGIVEAGIKLYFHRGRLVLKLKNIFPDQGARTIELTGDRVTGIRTWQHLAFVYDASSGKLSRLVDGLEDGVLWLTDSGAPGGSPWRLAVSERFKRQAQLGGGFRGRIDDFRLRRGAWVENEIGRYSTAHGQITSRVAKLGEGESRLSSINWEAETPAGSAILFEYRLSDSIFPANDRRLPWIRVKNGAQDFSLGQGRYLQWRAILLGSERGRYTPLLKSVSLSWNSTTRPTTPLGLRARAGDGRILVSWEVNLDRIAGYRIYLGTEKGEYLHPLSPIEIPLNRVKAERPEYLLRNLENDRLYYISVTAFTADGVESRYSDEIHARPEFIGGRF